MSTVQAFIHTLLLEPFWLLAALVVFVGCAQGAVPASGGAAPELAPGQYVPGELIVQFRAGTPKERIAEILAAHGLRIDREIAVPNAYLARTLEGQSLGELVVRLRAYKEVQSADPNWIRRFGPPPEPPRAKPAPDG